MKLSIPIVLLLLAGIALAAVAWFTPDREPGAVIAGRGEIPAELEGAAPPGYVRRTFEVEGMCCKGCTGTIHGALTALDGVGLVAVDLARETTEAFVREDVDPGQLVAAAEKEGYVLRDSGAPAGE